MTHTIARYVVVTVVTVALIVIVGCALHVPLGPGPGQTLSLQWFSPVQMPAGQTPATPATPTTQPTDRR